MSEIHWCDLPPLISLTGAWVLLLLGVGVCVQRLLF